MNPSERHVSPAFAVAHERTGVTGAMPRRHHERFDSWDWKASKFANDHLGVVDEDEEAAAVEALRRIGWPDRYDTTDAALRAAEAELDGPYGRRRCRDTNDHRQDAHVRRETRKRAA